MTDTEKVLENTIKRCRERDIIIPTYAEMVHPEKIPQGIKTELMFLVYSFPWYSNDYRLSPWKRRVSLQYS